MLNYNCQTYNNQRIITINKAICDKNNLYATINLQAIEYAMKTLNSQYGIKLWLYLAKNQCITLALSKKDFCEKANCSKQGYTTAFNDLVDNGFLVPIGEPNEKGQYHKYSFQDWGKAAIYENGKKREPPPKIDDGKFHF